jgi:hypothetical protein
VQRPVNSETTWLANSARAQQRGGIREKQPFITSLPDRASFEVRADPSKKRVSYFGLEHSSEANAEYGFTNSANCQGIT